MGWNEGKLDGIFINRENDRKYEGEFEDRKEIKEEGNAGMGE